MNPAKYVDQLGAIQAPDVFNPYRDTCAEHDHSTSAEIRRGNLISYIEAALRSGVDSLWLGRDCGYRGGRRTGIALTDEIQLSSLERQFDFRGLVKATIGLPVKERTATEVWKVVRELGAKPFLWNVFPFHPFESGKPMSNRRHTTREFDRYKFLLVDLVGLLKPRQIIALGADAHREVERLGLKASLIRHPSYGGHVEFAAGLQRLYSKAK